MLYTSDLYNRINPRSLRDIAQYDPVAGNSNYFVTVLNTVLR